jgi:membrane protease YdiL (CAAX protease family)
MRPSEYPNEFGAGWSDSDGSGLQRHAAPIALGALAAYNIVQNTAVPDRGYVAANLTATVGLLAFGRRAGSSWPELGFDSAALNPGIRLGAQVGVGTAAALSVAFAAAPTRRLLLDQRAYGHTPLSVLYRSLVRFPLGTALFEEVAFRGVLESLWQRRSGPRTARLVSAVAFGAWHLVPTYRLYPKMAVGSATPGRSERVLAALGSAVVTGLAGASFSWLRGRRDSVAAPWLAHASYNSLAFVAARLAWRLEHGRS